MKKRILSSLLLVTSILPVIPSWGQTDKSEWRHAVDVLKGKDTTKDKEWAVNLLLESQNYEKDAFVHNVLGIAFLHGIGVEADTVKAIDFFKESGAMGYSQAYHNLGMYYKYATGEKQNFQKAYEAFQIGANAGNLNNCYNTGFMLYKGLGCGQSYEMAIDYFRKAAVLNHPFALYMLGLCYRNGYGVEADTCAANAYLRQAAELGMMEAFDELSKEEPENSIKMLDASIDETIEVPLEMPAILPILPSNDISGSYNGVLATYDWSGQYLISEQKLSIKINAVNENLHGIWIQDVDTIIFTAVVDSDKIIHFNNTTADLFDRFSTNSLSKYRFDKVNLNYAFDIITGDLRLYSLSEREPERPMCVCLKRENTGKKEETKLFAYSSPQSNQITLKFELEENVPSASVSVYSSRTGMNVKNYKYGQLSAGDCMLSMVLDLPSGYYTIKLDAGKMQLNTILFKQ